ncbi:DNA topoisomerase IB [Alteromonas sp. 1_MG-2023]|uniref:DNA topoisomerase IB n=1 Tax=Alteromonas sp. 1_MG-2023 TaxID=3062669 RepID=UPI0026E15815|nr:DNA topoisomerase IB [Alteromonas sp. 1_MG-2023]MDO6568093.1 DNA topoisomerase IB [Alteromonas sp. 1_MG-2023]
MTIGQVVKDRESQLQPQPDRQQLHKNPHQHLSISRIRCGKGAYYRYKNGRKVEGERVLNRIKALAIPPNWKNVVISKEPKANIQAIGLDAKGRKQYLYHPEWHKQQQADKFRRLALFGEKMPEFRGYCRTLVNGEKWTLERASALVCLLLDYTGVRIGNSQYSKENNTYGLTTLRRKHVQEASIEKVLLAYSGKHSKHRTITIDDPLLASLVCECTELQGYSLFRYQLDNGSWCDIHSEDVNAFIHEHLGEDFSCKDFRTWAASRFALQSFPDVDRYLREGRNRKWPNSLSAHVSKMLGNTPTVCRQYYIHPKLYSVFDDKTQFEKLLMQLQQEQNELCDPTERDLSTEKLLLAIISSE